MSIVLVTDSTANIPEETIQHRDIKIVPLNVHVNDSVFREGIDLDKHEYYQLLKKEPIFPKTSQPSSGDFLSVFESYPPATEILVITISSHLSGTVQSAVMAAKLLNNSASQVTVVDSLSTTIGQGFLLEQASQMIDQGRTMEEIRQELERIKQNSSLFFLVANLEYLARGGRINQLSKYIGTILQLKPILYLQNGHIELYEKVRTWSRAMNRIVQELQGEVEEVKRLAVLHVDGLQEARVLRERVQEFYPGPVSIYEANPVIGTHVGPGTVGLAYHT